MWDDIIRAGSDDRISVHFIGSIVYVEQGLSQVTHQSPLLVIDGQQRLTTVTLLIAALSRAVGDSEPVDGFSRRKLRNYYLVNPEEEGQRHYKLLLSQTDGPSLMAAVTESPNPVDHSIRIAENYSLFNDWLSQPGLDLSVVCRGLAKLVVVDIALSREHDNPQLIFESMNSTGRELSQADLIRNYVLMALEPSLQTRLYEQFWRPMELAFGQRAYATDFDGFMRHYLTLKTGEIPNVGEVYDAFKKYARSAATLDKGIESLVQDVRAFAGYYCAMALGAEKDQALRGAFQDLRELKVDVAYPFLLELYSDFVEGLLTKDEFLRTVRLVEAYVFRRAVCSIPTNSMNKTFATFARAVRKDEYLESIEANFMILPSYRRFPDDEEFRRDLQSRDLYHFRSRSYLLRKLENFGRKEPVSENEFTIKHILPQNENLSSNWRAALGADWQKIQQTWLHTLGNLTLTGYNSEYSDRPFREKRDMPGGFRESPLRLNVGLAALDEWNDQTIQERAARLAAKAIDVWTGPSVRPEVAAAYRRKPSRGGGYTIEDHPQLVAQPLRDVFETLRAEIRGIDPCVTEEFLKFYVAYKAETNFVDVYPQAKRLRLILNLPFPEVNDPEGRCEDMSGYRLNGDVRVYCGSTDEIPYVLGLINQAFERQMGTVD